MQIGFRNKGSHSLAVESPRVGLVLEAGKRTRMYVTSSLMPQVFMLAAGVEPEIQAMTEMDVFVACCPPQQLCLQLSG